MIVAYRGTNSGFSLIGGKEYKVLSIEAGMYRIIDEQGYDPEIDDIPGFLYPAECFKIVSGSPSEYVDKYPQEDEEDEEPPFMDSMLKASLLLTDEQRMFVMEELDVTAEQLDAFTNNDWDNAYDVMCEIEVDETVLAYDTDLSERGRMAESIVTVMGNEMARLEGYMDEDEFNEFLDE